MSRKKRLEFLPFLFMLPPRLLLNRGAEYIKRGDIPMLNGNYEFTFPYAVKLGFGFNGLHMEFEEITVKTQPN